MENTVTISVKEYDSLRNQSNTLDKILKDEAQFIRTWSAYGEGYLHVRILEKEEALVKLAKEHFELTSKNEAREYRMNELHRTIENQQDSLRRFRKNFLQRMFS